MALSSPGVEVKVVDESFYTPAEPGTVPMIFIATSENKQNGAGDGIAPGTLKANAGLPYLITSQKDLVDTFGDPSFKTDSNNNPIHAGEQNEYGLQAAYSFLGVSNRAFVVRAAVDLTQLNPSVGAPAAKPINGTYWLDTQTTKWGIFEWDGRPVTAGGQKFVNKLPTVITDVTKVDELTGAPVAAVGKVGSYAIVTVDTSTVTPSLTDSHPMTLWYKNSVGNWVQVGSADWLTSFGANTPLLATQPHTNVPQWKTSALDAPSGSVWIKTTEPNLGSRWRTSRYNSATQLFEAVEAPLYSNAENAFYALDKTGGSKLAAGSLYTKYVNSNGISFKVYRRKSVAPLSIKTNKILATTFAVSTSYNFTIAETVAGSTALTSKVASFTTGTTVSAETNANALSAAINAAGFTNVSAEVDSQNRVVITHELGGDIHFTDGAGTPLNKAGFAAYNNLTGAGVLNLYTDGDGSHDFVASLWEPLVYVANETPPTSLTEDGQLWYSSVIDEVDIMVHDGTKWTGYLNAVLDANATGPIISATVPETQVDGTALVTGDLWIDTSDLENFPTIYKFNADILNAPIVKRWVLIDKTDQSSEDGVLFADARYNTAGTNSDAAGTIADLLVSDYLDPDAPDPALYPKGMLLWNLRRSGFNVKEFKQNYIDTTADNNRFNGEAMADYYPHRWVTISSNQEDGSGSFGRKAQRKVVVQSLQAMVNSNQEIRDDEGRIFNLMACPGYPELIGEMINLNFDRGLTAFVVGDTPARLTPDATSILRWGTNELLAPEDNDIGAASYDEYMGMFYPWGYTSDNFGNNIVVPPSHMILRTMALNDQVAYPWFAPAGVRRGGITNATSVGYVDSKEGEFKTVALNNGQRDTLYECKINPITFFTGVGLVNYGQKTRAKAASALDRINVARLVIYLRRQLSILAKPYVFEPNDKITRDELKAAVESVMLELVGQRALYDYLVVCDESNNTPARIDRNELWIDIAIEPVKAVEFIYIPLRLKNTGEISGL